MQIFQISPSLIAKTFNKVPRNSCKTIESVERNFSYQQRIVSFISCLPSQLFHCLSTIIAIRLCAHELSLVIVCESVVFGVSGVATDVDAVGKLARERFRLDATSVDEFVLLKDVPGGEISREFYCS